jgi:hypothetical protein
VDRLQMDHAGRGERATQLAQQRDWIGDVLEDVP